MHKLVYIYNSPTLF
jgi:hypothetical protein